MKTCSTMVSLILACLSGCSSDSVDAPTGPIARYGTTPTIDGVFEEGEWEDAAIVRADTVECFRIKHDGNNVYFGLRAGGGDLWLDTEAGLRVLHWSAQLGWLEYARHDTTTQSLAKPFEYTLWGLQHEPPEVVEETLAGYLSDHGWAANIAPLGNLYQSEVAVSFDWLGIDTESGRFVELPGIRIAAGLLITRNDPRAEALMAMTIEERQARYPMLYWPTEPAPDDSIGGGNWPETMALDPAIFGRIRVDLEGGVAAEHR